MSREYGMDPYDDSYDWQSKNNKRQEPDKPNGSRVLVEETTGDVVPDITKKGFFNLTRAFAENTGRIKDVSFDRRVSVIKHALVYALKTQPSVKAARSLLIYEPREEVEEQEQFPHINHVNGTNGHTRELIPSGNTNRVTAPRDLLAV